MPKKVTLELDDEIVAWLKYRKETYDAPEVSSIRRALRDAIADDRVYREHTEKSNRRKK